MWASTFSDFAKKAQELQEQAAEAATLSFTLWTPPWQKKGPSLFNLDSMQTTADGGVDPPQSSAATAVEPSVAVPMQARPSSSLFSSVVVTHHQPSPAATFSQTHSPLPKAVPAGKLVVPAISSPNDRDPRLEKQDTVAFSSEPVARSNTTEALLATVTSPPLDPVESATIHVDNSDLVKSDSDGWIQDDGDLNTDSGDDQHLENADQNKEKRADFQNAVETNTSTALCSPTESTHVNSLHHDDDQVPGGPNDAFSQDEENHEKETRTKALYEIKKEGPGALDPSNMTPQAEPTFTNMPVGDASVPIKAPHSDATPVMDMEKSADTADHVADAAHECTEPETPPSVRIAGKKLLVLMSSRSLERKVTTQQDTAWTILKSRGISYETLDGSDPTTKELRDELFQVSGCRGKYPQFFWVDLTSGSATYWGDWERFQQANDDGILQQELSEPSDKNHGSPRQPLTAETGQMSGDGRIESAAKVSDSLLEQFSHQLKRLEENFESERMEMERRHELEIQQIKESLNHDACAVKIKSLEDAVSTKEKEKQEAVYELMRIKEGYELRLDALKRETEGMHHLLASRDNESANASENRSKERHAWEEKVKMTEDELVRAKQQLLNTQTALDSTKGELAASKQELADLKVRVKGVATELVERRTECRELRLKVDDISAANEELVALKEKLEGQISALDRTRNLRDNELESVRAKLVDAEVQLSKNDQYIATMRADAEKTLADYKKKAQSSLSLANSRTAAAIQAKEEAELEARASRATADAAMNRAVAAEITCKEAAAEAKIKVQSAEKERDDALAEREQALQDLRDAQSSLTIMTDQLGGVQSDRDRLRADLEKAAVNYNDAVVKLSAVREENRELQSACRELRGENTRLRERLSKLEADLTNKSEQEPAPKDILQIETTFGPDRPLLDQHANESMVLTLQQELREANNAIEDLKEALRNAVELNLNRSAQPLDQLSHPESTLDGSDRSVQLSNGGEPIPLFYAMEKQAELITARAEINRLASVLADIQSEKMEALEVAEDMRKRMEDAEARLRRYEKLRSESVAGPTEARVNSPGSGRESRDSGAVNIEYLKNIMLSYLNANSIAERKALVPVIGAVLCLTSDEQRKVIESVDASGKLGAVGATFFESISGSLLSK